MKALSAPPNFAKTASRTKGSKAAGRRYEKAVVKHIKSWAKVYQDCKIVPGQWLEFQDAIGHGYAQPDILLIYPDRIVVLECKLSQTESARGQVMGLYKPLLEQLMGLPVFGVQVCKYLRGEQKNPIRDLESFAERKITEDFFCWHLSL